jgi:hypothetical protein
MLISPRFPRWLADETMLLSKKAELRDKTNILISLPNYSTGENNEAVHFKNDPLHS